MVALMNRIDNISALNAPNDCNINLPCFILEVDTMIFDHQATASVTMIIAAEILHLMIAVADFLFCRSF